MYLVALSGQIFYSRYTLISYVLLVFLTQTEPSALIFLLISSIMIIFYLFFSKNDSEKPWFRKGEDEKNAKARKAYESLMTVTLRKPTSDEYRNFSEEVKNRAKDKDVNFTYGDEEV